MSGSEEGKSHELVIIRRRASEDEGGHHGGVWKIAYADFMTAMMAFFLVMWLINSTDKKTLTQVATYFNPMRLTDKRPSPKGLDEPDGSEGKDSTAKKGAKKKDGETKGKKKADEPQPGEVRSRGQPFPARAWKIRSRKIPTESGATSGESPRQAGGRAYRDPFDTVHRSEIVPSEPSNGKSAHHAARVAPQPWNPSAPTPPSRRRKRGARTHDATRRSASRSGSEREAPVRGKASSCIAATVEGSQRPRGCRAAGGRHQAGGCRSRCRARLPNIDVVVTPDGVLISLTDDYEFGMFAIASAEPRPAMVVVMDKVAKILQTRPEPLVIRGHTDRRPYRTATYDNWRLSAARAHMAYVMLARSGVDEKRFERIEGHADRSLRVQHDPEAAQNRRIEILLRKQTP